MLWDTSRPYDSGSGLDDGSVGVLVLQIPKARLPLAAPQVDRLVARRMDSTTGMRAVPAQFLGAVARNGSDCQPHDLGSLGSVAVELAAACLIQQLGAEPQPPEAARAHVLLRQIDAFIEQNLADPDLTPRAIADQHHISLRSLYTLFQDHVERGGCGGDPQASTGALPSRSGQPATAPSARSCDRRPVGVRQRGGVQPWLSRRLRRHPAGLPLRGAGAARGGRATGLMRPAVGSTLFRSVAFRAGAPPRSGPYRCTDRQEGLHGRHNLRILPILGSRKRAPEAGQVAQPVLRMGRRVSSTAGSRPCAGARWLPLQNRGEQ
ncbi:hypothetical protein [Streptomyces sp. NPDC002403]